jgi:polygalacturonase
MSASQRQMTWGGLLLALLGLAGCVAAPTTATSPAALDVPPAAPQASYNVRDFGAKGDAQTKDTAAFQKALDTCAVNGGGEVVVPAGEYLIGSIQLGSHTLLRLEAGALLTGSPDLDDYPLIDVRWEGRWLRGHRALIYAANVDHIGIVGPGAIRGNSAVAASNVEPRGALIIEPISCRGVRLEGFATTQGGNNWNTHPTYCADVLVKNVNIFSARDGIDVDSCQNVLITGCDINSGDDSVSIKSGRGMDGARIGRPTADVLITHCTMRGRTFACIGIGSEISAGVRNLRIEHCQFTANTQAIYLKTRIGRAGVVENISGDDIDVLAGDFLRLNLTRGGNTNTADDPVEGLVGYPLAKNIRFTNIRVTGKALVTANDVSARRPIEGLVLENISGTCTKGLVLANIVGVELKNIQVTGYTGPLLGIYNVTGTGLEGAVAIPAPVDPAPVK